MSQNPSPLTFDVRNTNEDEAVKASTRNDVEFDEDYFNEDDIDPHLVEASSVTGSQVDVISANMSMAKRYVYMTRNDSNGISCITEPHIIPKSRGENGNNDVAVADAESTQESLSNFYCENDINLDCVPPDIKQAVRDYRTYQLQEKLYHIQTQLAEYHALLDDYEYFSERNKELERQIALIQSDKINTTFQKVTESRNIKLEEEIISLKLQIADRRSAEDHHEWRIRALREELAALKLKAQDNVQHQRTMGLGKALPRSGLYLKRAIYDVSGRGNPSPLVEPYPPPANASSKQRKGRFGWGFGRQADG